MSAIWFRSNGPPQYRFLSNFHVRTFNHGSMVCRSAEHAYQALKCSDEASMGAVLSALRPVDAMRLGRQADLHWTWNAIMAMHGVIDSKFADPDLRRLLLATGDAELIEDNRGPWGGRNGGENRLGKLLMKLRFELREEA